MAVVSDLMRVAREIRSGSPERVSPFAHERLGEYQPVSVTLQKRAYYLRFRVEDRPGIIATLAGILAEQEYQPGGRAAGAVRHQARPAVRDHGGADHRNNRSARRWTRCRGSISCARRRWRCPWRLRYENDSAHAALRWRWPAALPAQVATDANSGYQTEQQRKARGQGSGRSGARRQAEARASSCSDMGVQPGMTVADVGTGIGYMLPFLSRAVGPQGKVIAEDIFDDFLAGARSSAPTARS